jgi:hypothetical protein
MADIESRITSWDRKKLEREGMAIFDLKAQVKGFLFNDALIVFRPNQGNEMPFHKFAHGDMVMMSCTIGEKAVVLDGIVADKSKTTLTVSSGSNIHGLKLGEGAWVSKVIVAV